MSLDKMLMNGERKSSNGTEKKKILFKLQKMQKNNLNKLYVDKLVSNKKIVNIAKISKLKD